MDVTDEIKARIDIVDFISRYVPLKRAGRTYKALCPFHQENTPSFVVFPETGTWRCFGACGTGGDLFSFAMSQENLDFREALEMLAQEAGIELEESPQDRQSQERTRLYEANALAAQYFRNLLHRHPSAEKVRGYLQERGIDAPIAEQFQLGFSLDSWDSLRDHLTEHGYSLEEQVKAGLLKHNEPRDSYYDAFRNRLMIPISDRQGRVIGFGGRVLDDSVPKYLNTAETPIFRKSATVYAIDRAYKAIRQADEVVIVEGYMDVIAAHQFGHNNVVACLGTALTEEQLQLLQRYTNNYVLALDADSAGQKATIRGLNQARQALKRVRRPTVTPSGQVRIESRLGANLRIVSLPDGQDPDDILRTDVHQWQTLVDEALPLVDYFINVVAHQSDLSSAQGKAEAVAELVPLVAELDDNIERQHYVQRLSRMVQIDEQTIAQRVQAAAHTLSRQKRIQKPTSQGQSVSLSQRPLLQPTSIDGLRPQPDVAGQPQARERGQGKELGLEVFLLAHLVQEPNLLVWLAGMAEEMEIVSLRAEELQRADYRELFLALKRFITSDETWDLEAFQENLPSNLHKLLAELVERATQLPEREPLEIQEAVLKALIRMRRDRLRDDLVAMQFLLQDAQQTNDRDAVLGYSTAINSNRRDRHHLEQVMAKLNRVSYGAKRLEQGIRIA